jgi:hypothetical protein
VFLEGFSWADYVSDPVREKKGSAVPSQEGLYSATENLRWTQIMFFTGVGRNYTTREKCLSVDDKNTYFVY